MIFQEQKKKAARKSWEFENGIFRSYFKNGRLRVEGKAVINERGKLVLNGYTKYYWGNGKLRSEGEVKINRWVGRVKAYDKSGVLIGIYEGKACLGKSEEEYFMAMSW